LNKKLRDLFFDEYGRFSQRTKDHWMKPELILTVIEFQDLIQETKGDRQLQVEFKQDKHMFEEIEKILVEYKIIDDEKEYMSDPLLLIGGICNQQCHMDIPCLHTSIRDRYDRNFCEVGYEVDREQYSNLVSSPYAPTSIMLDLSVCETGFF
jgi:hypothetical protein